MGLRTKKYLPLIKNRNSGFTRLTVIGERRGDAAKMVRLELIEVPVVKKAKEAKTPQKAAQKTKTKPAKK